MTKFAYDKTVFVKNLTEYMRRLGEKQVGVAKTLKVSKSTVSACCAGKQIPRMDKTRPYGKKKNPLP